VVQCLIPREAIVKTFYERFCRPVLKQLEDPGATQETCLKKILKRCENTVFGRQYGFSDITSIEEFQRKVPLTTYESLQPYIARCSQGEQNVLFPDKIVKFLVTSGTTGDPKYHPFGECRVEEFILDSLMASVFYLVHTGNYDIMDGAVLALTASPQLGQKIGEYDVAFFSGGITGVPIPERLQKLRNLRLGMSSSRVPPQEVALCSDWAEKFYLTARHAVAADVRSIIGETSKIVSQLRKIKSDYYNRLLADPALNEKIKEKLRKVSQNGSIDLQELWPNFRLVFAGGISLTPYRRQIQDLLGNVDIWEQYGASEASLGLKIFPDKGIIPMIHRTFFEFIPDNEENTTPVPISDVKRNTPYRIIVTNNGGFYRYDLGDLVVFTDLDPPVIGEISRKKALVSLVGERTSEELILRVLERACEQFKISFVDFALLPEVTDKIIRYHLFVEFTQLPDDLEEFTSVVDTRLSIASFIYSIKRKQKVMSSLVIVPVQPGGFDITLLKLGKTPEQGKLPRLLTPELSRLIPLLNPSSQL